MVKLSRRLLIAGGLSAVGLAGCYVVPVNPDGSVSYAVVPAGAAPAPVPPAAAVSLSARLYPDNDLATQTGLIAGSLTNMMDGRGRFQLEYRGELLAGEATRMRGDERRGIASAYGPRGTFMSCEYQMATPVRGTGTCRLSDGARYRVHIGG
ncbi:MAG: hypothetical protein KJ025_08000 [Burkholderiales bacterium]|nr:hypothetical protein [Burkholderiales bacterium]